MQEAQQRYMKPAPICQRSVPSNIGPEPTQSSKLNSHVHATLGLTSLSPPDPTVSSHSLHYSASQCCRPVQKVATKLIRSAGPELIWSNRLLLHPNTQHNLPYQPNKGELTNSHPLYTGPIPKKLEKGKNDCYKYSCWSFLSSFLLYNRQMPHACL